MTDVLLISVPFNDIDKPVIALGILKQALIDSGIDCGVMYSNLDFAHQIGYDNYLYIQKLNSEFNAGEWIFSHLLHTKKQTDIDNYLSRLRNYSIQTDILLECLQHLERFIFEQATIIISQKPKLVGVSSMFQQHCASLCLLKKVKELDPNITTCMGGANCEHIMGLTTHKLYPFVDYIMLGEGDTTLPLIGKSVLSHTPLISSKGIVTPHDRINDYAELDLSSFRVSDSKDIKAPDYDEYFDTLKRLAIDKWIRPGLLVESSRGCWWGEKCPCSFCSLNGLCNKYRCRNHVDVLSDLETISKKYDLYGFQFTDNIIPNSAFSTLLPELINSKKEYHLFFETKSNLSKKQIEMLHSAGVTWVQAGIECLNNNLLKSLRKGVTVYHNVQFLKWCMEQGINVSWNIITHIPGREKKWLLEMNDLIPKLFHLQPPFHCYMRLDRFSDYFNNPDHYHLSLKPGWTYPFIYPHEPEILDNLAYYFEDNSKTKTDIYDKLTIRLIQQWNNLHHYEDDVITRPLLEYTDDGEQLIIKDTRPCSISTLQTLAHLERSLLLYCDCNRHIDQIYQHFESSYTTRHIIDTTLKLILDKNLMIVIHDKYLSLPINASRPPLYTMDKFPGGIYL